MTAQSKQQTSTLITELFDIVPENLPPLSAYELIVRGSNNRVRSGRKLADRLMRHFGSHWVWTDDVIVTDVPQSSEAIESAIRDIRIKESEAFKDLTGISLLDQWVATPRAQADFVAQGLFFDIGGEIQEALQPSVNLDGKATVERQFNVRGWVVDNKPTVSISIESQVIFRDDLKTYMSRLSSAKDVVGLYVSDKVRFDNGTFMKGEIMDIVGKLDEDIDRQALIDIAKRDGSKQIIQKAAKGELVVKVGHSEYEYVISALRIIVFPKYYKRFGIDTRKAQAATWITPKERAGLVNKVSNIARSRGLIGDTYTSKRDDARFTYSKKFYYDPTVLLGNNQTIEYKGGSSLLNALGRHGLYNRISNVGSVDVPLNIGVLNASHNNFDVAQEALEKQLKIIGFHTSFHAVSARGTSRINFEHAINELQASEPHIIVAVIPDSDSSDEDEWGPYYDFKSLMMSAGMASQVLDAKTLTNTKGLPFVMQNVAFGMLAKMGNIPYVLANPMDYADIVVGIDIARKRNKSGIGSQNAAAIAQVYHQGGQFAQCRVVETPLEGETVPAKILRSLFPLNEFQGKRVIIHRDGPFRGEEVDIIQDHMNQLNGEVFFIEVIKSGSPRLYLSNNKQIQAPGIGTAFLLSDTEAFLVASESSTATPQPLQIRTREPFTIGKSLHSVLMLTLMHYGSLRRPRSPITIHYSDKIGYLALRGVKPAGGVSTDMYWL
jgi:hypothetical protein